MSIVIRVDSGRNRVYVTFSGVVSDEECRVAADHFISTTARMRPGVTAVTDLSEARPLSRQGLAEVKRAAQGGLGNGMKAVARVLHASTVAASQLNRLRTDSGYRTYTVTSRAEADAVLDADGKADAGPAVASSR